jgi:nucleotidyltransferase substrate binding protein (TIGR01987 family)
MSNADEIRFKQRLQNLEKAMNTLSSACKEDHFSELERAGLIKVFEVAFELAWKTLKDLLFYEGYEENSPRSVIRKSFSAGYLNEETTELLLEALDKRNILSHTYDESTAEEAVELITQLFAPALQTALKALRDRRDAS